MAPVGGKEALATTPSSAPFSLGLGSAADARLWGERFDREKGSLRKRHRRRASRCAVSGNILLHTLVSLIAVFLVLACFRKALNASRVGSQQRDLAGGFPPEDSCLGWEGDGPSSHVHNDSGLFLADTSEITEDLEALKLDKGTGSFEKWRDSLAKKEAGRPSDLLGAPEPTLLTSFLAQHSGTSLPKKLRLPPSASGVPARLAISSSGSRQSSGSNSSLSDGFQSSSPEADGPRELLQSLSLWQQASSKRRLENLLRKRHLEWTKAALMVWGAPEYNDKGELLFLSGFRIMMEVASTCKRLILLLQPEHAVFLTMHVTAIATVELSALAYLDDHLQPQRLATLRAFIELGNTLLAVESGTFTAAQQLGVVGKLKSYRLLMEEIAGKPVRDSNISVQVMERKLGTQMKLCRCAFSVVDLLMRGLLPGREEKQIPPQEPLSVIKACRGILNVLIPRLAANTALRPWLCMCQRKLERFVVFTPKRFRHLRHVPMEKFADALTSIEKAIIEAGCTFLVIGDEESSGYITDSSLKASAKEHVRLELSENNSARSETQDFQPFSASSLLSSSAELQPSDGRSPSQRQAGSNVSNFLPPGLSFPTSDSPASHVLPQSVRPPDPTASRHCFHLTQLTQDASEKNSTVQQQHNVGGVFAQSSALGMPPAHRSQQPSQVPEHHVEPKGPASAVGFRRPHRVTTQSELSQQHRQPPPLDRSLSIQLPQSSFIWAPSVAERFLLPSRVPQKISVLESSYDSPHWGPALSLRLPGESSIWSWTHEDQVEYRQLVSSHFSDEHGEPIKSSALKASTQKLPASDPWVTPQLSFHSSSSYWANGHPDSPLSPHGDLWDYGSKADDETVVEYKLWQKHHRQDMVLLEEWQ
ncbi:hypothetical protein Efla_006084 [Eimeria flavescens]